MTDFKRDLEYWNDQVVEIQKIIDPMLTKMHHDGPDSLTFRELFLLRSLLCDMKASIHWLDQTVNQYPKPPKKFWQFWK